jgi:hypothetical protein
MTARPLHLVFPSQATGPLCNPNCPGEGSEYHDGYADGHEQGQEWGEQRLASLVRASLPMPALPPKPSWIVGPTRSHWTREGIRVAMNALGFRQKTIE